MEIIFITAPHEQSMGFTSKIFLNNRAHVLRVSAAKSESSSFVMECAAFPEKSCANGVLTLPLERLLLAPYKRRVCWQKRIIYGTPNKELLTEYTYAPASDYSGNVKETREYIFAGCSLYEFRSDKRHDWKSRPGAARIMISPEGNGKR